MSVMQVQLQGKPTGNLSAAQVGSFLFAVGCDRALAGFNYIQIMLGAICLLDGVEKLSILSILQETFLNGIIC